MLDLTELPTGQARHSMGQLWGQLLRLRLASQEVRSLSAAKGLKRSYFNKSRDHFCVSCTF